MSGFFSQESKFVKFGNRITDLLLLQLATLLCCLPIFTIGASVTAMHHVLLKLYRKEEPYVIPTFFRAFRKNFKQATLTWLIYLGAIVLILADLFLSLHTESVYLYMSRYLLIVPAILVAFSLSWVFVLLSRYDNGIWTTIRNSMIMVLRFPIKSLSMLVLLFMPLAAMIFFDAAIPFVVLYGFSGPGYIRTLLYSQIFDDLEDSNWRKKLAEQTRDP